MNPPSEESTTCHLCPYCYEKVVNLLEFLPTERSTKLAQFYGDLGLIDEQKWENKLLSHVREKLEVDGSNKRRRSGVSRLSDIAPTIVTPKKKLKASNNDEFEDDEGATVVEDDEDAEKMARTSPRRISKGPAGITATTKPIRSTSNTSATVPTTVRSRLSSSRAAHDVSPQPPSVAGSISRLREESVSSTSRLPEESVATNGVVIAADTTPSTTVPPSIKENVWRDAIQVYFDVARAGKPINNRNLQYCMLQFLASLKIETDEDFNQASVLADVKRHKLHMHK
jgi:hypothetical protein